MSLSTFLRTAPLGLLTLSASFVDWAHAQSAVAGDLTLAAPYGIPPGLFNTSIMRTVRQSAVWVPGYNLSAPEGFGPSGNGSAVDGWQLGVAVADNVPLRDAEDPGVDRAQVIDATTLWLQAPAGVEYLNATAWKLCATVFPYVNMSAVVEGGDGDGQNNGNCGAWLTDECAAAVNEAALAHGMNAAGDCFNMTIPERCAPYFMRNGGNGTVVVLDEKTLADGRFYAWGSPPTSTGDTDALESALGHVWPVLLTWIQFSPGGGVFSANTHVSCLAASSNGTGTAKERESQSERRLRDEPDESTRQKTAKGSEPRRTTLDF
ncbi:hypothetical protein SPBR_08538 [Sporothrix brasiliensis 5110]|uniref:Uncharacterized protein n=1 Tax=Sporothrix brasiliensis 5110 TaxID=1398154 RepID=A0A0C2II77_9PEZI|nr:uncharacterized protein SPBR_08538 [Sporothrix brasiliensis 5110]KIH86660.1 hypothetical protein SPBR_08538 [Sporothrix brasiliensis 5110]